MQNCGVFFRCPKSHANETKFLAFRSTAEIQNSSVQRKIHRATRVSNRRPYLGITTATDDIGLPSRYITNYFLALNWNIINVEQQTMPDTTSLLLIIFISPHSGSMHKIKLVQTSLTPSRKMLVSLRTLNKLANRINNSNFVNNTWAQGTSIKNSQLLITVGAKDGRAALFRQKWCISRWRTKHD